MWLWLCCVTPCFGSVTVSSRGNRKLCRSVRVSQNTASSCFSCPPRRALELEVLDDEEAAKIAATPLASVAAIGQLLDSMVAESYAYALNTTYAAALLTALGSGQTVDTTLPMWAAYAEATSQVSKQRLKLSGARMAQVLNSLYSDSIIAK